MAKKVSRVVAKNKAKQSAKRVRGMSSDLGTAQLINNTNVGASGNVFSTLSPSMAPPVPKVTPKPIVTAPIRNAPSVFGPRMSGPEAAQAIVDANVEATITPFGTGGMLGHYPGAPLKRGPYNSIDLNKGEGFFKKIISDAKKIPQSEVGKKFDDATGLFSLMDGFGDTGKQYQGNVISRAAQNAGYIKKNAAGELESVDYKKIAMGYMGASAAARVATGGGIYKDGQGNTNVIGIPLI